MSVSVSAWRERDVTVLHQLLLGDNAVALGTEPRVFVARELRGDLWALPIPLPFREAMERLEGTQM